MCKIPKRNLKKVLVNYQEFISMFIACVAFEKNKINKKTNTYKTQITRYDVAFKLTYTWRQMRGQNKHFNGRVFS